MGDELFHKTERSLLQSTLDALLNCPLLRVHPLLSTRPQPRDNLRPAQYFWWRITPWEGELFIETMVIRTWTNISIYRLKLRPTSHVMTCTWNDRKEGTHTIIELEIAFNISLLKHVIHLQTSLTIIQKLIDYYTRIKITEHMHSILDFVFRLSQGYP